MSDSYFKNIRKVYLFLIILLFCHNSNAQEYITLANEENTEYKIMVGPQATDIEIFAAQELQGYLLQVSGAFMPMAYENEKTYKKLILVGKSAARLMLPESAFGKLQDDEFIVKVIGDKLILSGNSPRGTLYSVYAFLESLGCRWFAPWVIGEVIPRLSVIVLTNLNYNEKPSFKYRGFMCIFENTCQSVAWIDWMAKNKLNYVMTSQASFETFNNVLFGEAKKRGIYIGVRIEADEKNNLEQITNFINNNPNIDMIEIVASDAKLGFLLKEIYHEKIISILIKGNSTIPTEQEFKDIVSFSYEADSRCYRHSLDDQDCKINHDYRTFIEKVSNENRSVFIHEYYMGSYEQNSFPFPVLNSIASDTKYFLRKGIEGIISQSEIGNWGTYGLNYYVFSKMVWNPEYNLGTIVDDYCEKYFGSTSQYMKRYFAALEDAVVTGHSPSHLFYIDSPEKLLNILNEDILREMEMQIENAKILADDVVIFDRIRKVQISFEYMKLVWKVFYFYSASQSSKNKEEIQKDLQVVIESGEQLLKHLVTNIDEEVFIVTESYVLDLIEPIITDARLRLQ